LPTEPSYLKDNPWKDILKKRGKDGGQPTRTVAKPPLAGTTHGQSAQATGNNRQKRPGPHSRREIEARRRKVLQLYLRGINADEVSQATGFPLRTVYKDLVHLKNWLKIEFARERLYTVSQAVAELDEMWREAWSIFHKSAPLRKDGSEVDVSGRKLAALDCIMTIQKNKCTLLGLLSRDQPPQLLVDRAGPGEDRFITDIEFGQQVRIEAEKIRALESPR